jgi:hypothetical protein
MAQSGFKKHPARFVHSGNRGELPAPREMAMTTNSGRKLDPKAKNGASPDKPAREREAAPEDVPVKQHNPDGKGINPNQEGPAQPGASSD